jgi:(p)ppGpp synthase/HD superfamily hydrolase
MPDTTKDPLLGPRFLEALTLAFQLHRFHDRKSTRVPYFSHLMSVSSLVLEDGGDEDEAIAALLHDVLEDCADRITAEEIEARFGPRVRELVEACTDTPPDFRGGKKPNPKALKKKYTERIATGAFPMRVSLADKLHNSRSILRDHRKKGERVWDIFAGTKEDTLSYYRELVAAYRTGGMTGFLIEEYDRVVKKLGKRADGGA